MPTAKQPTWTHDGAGKHTLQAGVLTLVCEFKADAYTVSVNGVRSLVRPRYLAEAKQVAHEAARQMLNRTRQLLAAAEQDT